MYVPIVKRKFRVILRPPQYASEVTTNWTGATPSLAARKEALQKVDDDRTWGGKCT